MKLLPKRHAGLPMAQNRLPHRNSFMLALTTFCRGVIVLAFALPAAYAAWPMWSAFQLKQAIRTADTATLERKIEWDSVRSSLRNSLQADMLGIGGAADSSRQPGERIGFWRRIKLSLGERAVDGFVDAYITPEGLPLIERYRQTFREEVKQPFAKLRGKFGISANVARGRLGLGVSEVADAGEVKPFWQRIERVAFLAFDRFEIQLTHPDHPGKLIISELALREDEWKLSKLAIKPLVAKDDEIARDEREDD